MYNVFVDTYRGDQEHKPQRNYKNVEFCRYVYGPTSDIVTKKDQKKLFGDLPIPDREDLKDKYKGYIKDPRYKCYAGIGRTL
jgi:hypothetical protein